MWWLLLIFLAPLWGWYIWDMSEAMVEKAGFMRERGLTVSPSIEIFANLSWAQVLGAGSLLGFLFYALPIALVVSLFETLARSLRQKKFKWMMRLSGMLWVVTPLGMAVHAFVSSWLASFGIAAFCMLLCGALAKLFEAIKSWTQGTSLKTRILVLGLMLLCVIHFLTHPVLHIAFQPNAYAKVNAMTVVRDWLLLDQKSSHWVNSWYYNHTAIAMEREKITTFQPMVVGLIDINPKIWQKRLSSFFASRPKDHGQKIKFIQIKSKEAIEEYLKKDFVHFIAIGAGQYENMKNRVKSWPRYSYAFFGTNPIPYIPKEVYFTPQNFYGKAYTRLGYNLKETPVLKRKDFLQDVGVNQIQTDTNTHFKRGLGFLLSHPSYSLSLLFLLLSGALIVLFRLMILVGKANPWLMLAFPVLMSYYSIPGMIANIAFWTEEPGIESASNELRILALNELVLNPDCKKLQSVLKQDLAGDLRVAKWQVACMGTIYKSCSSDSKQKAVAWMKLILDHYHEFPFGFRYKIVEAAVKMRPLNERIHQHSKEEKHVYVRWYAENFGLGI